MFRVIWGSSLIIAIIMGVETIKIAGLSEVREHAFVPIGQTELPEQFGSSSSLSSPVEGLSHS